MLTPQEHRTIREIADRAVSLYSRMWITLKREFVMSELQIVHEEIYPLRLQELLDADDSNFVHDISGIHRHLQIGKPSRLTDCFRPRYAEPQRRVAAS